VEHPRPDDKGWTWVLDRPCPACRFEAGTIARHMIGATLRTTVEAWREVLSRSALVRQRPPGPAARDPICGPPSSMAATSATCSCCSRSASD
jgi:hypothetical protein